MGAGKDPHVTTANTIPPPKLAWHDVHWLQVRSLLAHRCNEAQDDNWRVRAGGADMSAEKGKIGRVHCQIQLWRGMMETSRYIQIFCAFLALQRPPGTTARTGRDCVPLRRALTEAQLSQLASVAGTDGLARRRIRQPKIGVASG